MAAVLLVNDLLAGYFAAFFVGITGLIEQLVAAREEGRLEILRSKPVPASAFLAARVLPVLVAATAVGVLVSITTAVAIRPYLAGQEMVTSGRALGGCLFLVSLAVFLLCALVPLLVKMRDSFHALLVASSSGSPR